MSKDIRSFFRALPKSNSKNFISEKRYDSKEKIDEPIPKKKLKHESQSILSKHKTYVISSDSEDEKITHTSLKKNELKEEKKVIPICVDEYFGDEHIKMKWKDKLTKSESNEEFKNNKTFNTDLGSSQSDKHLRSVKKKKKDKSGITEINVHGDENFEKTLGDLDDNDIIDNLDILDRTIEDATKQTAGIRGKKQKSSFHRKNNSDQPAAQKKRKKDNIEEESASKKTKLEHIDSGVNSDQEKHEKKRYSAMLYQQYLHRGGPKNHGQKQLPKGNSDSLKNLTFLRTGVLDSIDSEEFENLVKEHGGRVVHAVSRKVNFIVIGEDPGPAKLEKARGYNIPEINEDKFFDLILTNSGKEPTFSKLESVESYDSGINNSGSFDKSPIKHETKMTDIAISKSKMNETRKSKNTSIESGELKQGLDIGISSSKESFKTSRKVQELPTNQAAQILSWSDKYKPKDIKGILGQQDASSNMNKLKKWLMNWYRNQQPEMRKKVHRPSPWAKNDDGAYFKAALLSGPPGVGKTTTATLVSKELSFDVVEFNASDTRNKKLLREEVAQLLGTTSIAGFALGDKTTTKKRVLLMDEVDGMAGNEDRGGMQELITLIKNTSIPIICMCNDRNHQKIRSLVNYCFDVRFNKPKPQQILSGIMSICYKEGIKLSSDALIEIINGTGCDIRQTLNHLSMWTSARNSLTLEMASKEVKVSKKDTVMGPWEVTREIFNSEKQLPLADKFKLFYYDYSLGPLFVQENYLAVTPKCSAKEKMKLVFEAADAISLGDIIDSKLRGSNNWSLLETQALFSSILPGHNMHGNIQRINFPSWLGKNSSASKSKRMLGEVYSHTRTSTSGSKLAISLDYLVPLRDTIIFPLQKLGISGIQEAIKVMKTYNLTREDLTNLIELCQWKNSKNPFQDIDSKVKSAFTRAYNKEAPLLPFSSLSAVSKKNAINVDFDKSIDAEYGDDSDTELEDVIETDKMIKVNNKTKTKTDSKQQRTSTNQDVSLKAKNNLKKKESRKGR